MEDIDETLRDHVRWFRHFAPYVQAHRARTFVVVFGGEAVADGGFPSLVHDLGLLESLGVRLVLVHGARPQIEKKIRERGLTPRYVRGLRVTDDAALACVKDAVGSVRVEIEARLSMGLANSPMAGARIRVASGNFVTAQPFGVREGVDYGHTGEVRRVDAEAIRQRLDSGAIVLVSPIGYSPAGEVFNLSHHDVAAAVAVSMRADKLLCLVEGRAVVDTRRRTIRELLPLEAERLIATRRLPDEVERALIASVRACHGGVRRAHLVGRPAEGALLLELYTRDGIGTMVTSETFEGTRAATIDDVGGILELTRPLATQGILVERSRERLENEIDRFTVVERDRAIIACASLHPYPEAGMAELACLAVHPDYREGDRGEVLLRYLERRAHEMGIGRLFVLTTRTFHWFLEHGFRPARVRDLPEQKRSSYDRTRRSKVLVKDL